MTSKTKAKNTTGSTISAVKGKISNIFTRGKPPKSTAKNKKGSVKSKKSSAKSTAKKKEAKPKAKRQRPIQRQGFKTGEHIVYPAHGVGKIVDYQEQQVVGYNLRLFSIFFPKDKMTIKVPIDKIKSVGMRKLANPTTMRKALRTVQEKPKIKRIMWSRRAQEYEAKINSGDLIQVSEVVRDLFRAEGESEQSYSERQLYEAALGKMTSELSVIKKITETEAIHLVELNLAKRPARASRVAADKDKNKDKGKNSDTKQTAAA